MVPAFAVASIIADGVDNITSDPEALAVLLGANLVLEASLIGAAFLFSVFKYKVSWRDLGFRMPQRGGFWLPVAAVVSAWIIIAVYFGVISAVGPDWLVPDESSIPDSAFDEPIVIPIAVVLTLLFAPLMEETFFRGFVFGALRFRWGVLGAALASGFLFAALHFQVGTVIPFTAIGILFALVYVYSGSLFASIIAHLLFNGVSVIIVVAGG